MTATFYLTLLCVSVLAFVAGWVLGALAGQLHEAIGYIVTFWVAAAIGMHWFSELLPLLVVTLAPLWVAVFLALVYEALRPRLAKRGYLGNRRRWLHELSDDDKAAQAAVTLLDDETIDRVAETSADARDFRQNLVEAAGLEGHDEPASE